MPKDAVSCYRDVLKITAFVLGQEIVDGKLLLNAKLSKYLRRKGVLASFQLREQANTHHPP